MATITIHDAQAKLGELIHQLIPGEELAITENGETVAKLTRSPRTSWPSEAGTAKKPQFGTLNGTVLSMDHFDDPLEDFEEYM